MDFNDWIETMRAVSSIESCRNLVSLGLNINVLYLEFTNQGYRSKFINTALGNLPSLERLDLSYNAMFGPLKGILPHLRLSYLNVSCCYLLCEDLQMILCLLNFYNIQF